MSGCDFVSVFANILSPTIEAGWALVWDLDTECCGELNSSRVVFVTQGATEFEGDFCVRCLCSKGIVCVN